MKFFFVLIAYHLGSFFFLFCPDTVDSPAIADDSHASARWKQSTDYNPNRSDSDSTTINTSCTRFSGPSFLTSL